MRETWTAAIDFSIKPISSQQYSGAAVSIAAQYQPEQYERLRARIRAINAAAAASPHTHRHTHVPVHPDLHAVYQR